MGMKKLFYIFAVVITLCACSRDLGSGDLPDYVPRTRTYYVAAENVQWDYAPLGKDPMMGMALPSPWGDQTVYDKVRFVEYSDETFTKKKAQPQWLGILGPVIRGVEGDTIEVVFKNNGDKPYSIHPHGLTYNKKYEGAGYSGVYGDGAKVEPGETFTYFWDVGQNATPGPEEGGSKVWLYHSHVDSVGDIYAGLYGAIIITRAEDADAETARPKDVDREFVTLFMVNNESKDEEVEGDLMHAINGYVFGNLRGLEMYQGEKVRWHLLALGSEVDLHSAHWHGEVVEYEGRKTDVVELMPASMKTVDMVAENIGEWMYHCHVADHVTAGMMTTYTIKPSPVADSRSDKQ